MVRHPLDSERLWASLNPLMDEANEIERDAGFSWLAFTAVNGNRPPQGMFEARLAKAKAALDRLAEVHARVIAIHDAFLPEHPPVSLIEAVEMIRHSTLPAARCPSASRAASLPRTCQSGGFQN